MLSCPTVSYAYSQQPNYNYESQAKNQLHQQLKRAMDLGIQSFQNGNYKTCIKALLFVRDNYSKTGESLNRDTLIRLDSMIGESYRQLNNLNKAITYLNSAYEQGSRSELVLRGLGYSFMDIEQTEFSFSQAKRYLYELVNKKPTAEYLYNLGYVCNSLGDYKESVAIFDKLIRINPKYDINVYVLCATGLESLEDFDGAINYLLLGMKAYPSEEFFPLELMNVFFAFDDYENAIVYGNKALQINDKNVISLATVGLSYIYFNNLDDACYCYEKAIQLNLQHPLLDDLGKLIAQKKQEMDLARLVEQQIIDEQLRQQDIVNSSTMPTMPM